MDKICGIYVITNNVNGKQYIGLSKNCLKRWADHYSKAYTSKKEDDINKVLYKAMRKYGRENFSFRILEECSEEQLQEREIYWIDQLKTYDNGYNETRGGELSGPKSIHLGEDHGMAKLTEEEVIQCRKWYSEGQESHKIWKEYFQEKISYSGFQRMWHGQTWKHVMPEVFSHNPRPRKKFSDELKKQIKDMYNIQNMTCAEIYHYFNGTISRTSINDYCHNRR